MIKKVVIPEKEIKYSIELSQKEFGKPFATKHIHYSRFTETKTLKPLANDEISCDNIEPCKRGAFNKLYAFIYGEGIYFLCWDVDDEKYKAVGFSTPHIGNDQWCWFSLKEAIKSLNKRRVDYIYQFDTSADFIEWAKLELKI